MDTPDVPGAAPPLLPRSPYRGYKPNMATLLKELRARSQAGRRKATPDQEGAGKVPQEQDTGGMLLAGQQAGRPAGQVATAGVVDVGQLSDQLAMVQVRPQGRDAQDAWRPAPSVTASMLLGSPTSVGLRGEMQEVDGGGPALDHPQLYSALGIMGRMEALAQGEQDPPPALPPHQQAEAVRRAAAVTANIPPGVKLYHNLQAIGGTVFAPKPAKQLDAKWVASRTAKPEISSLWDAQDQQREVCSTRGVAQYVRPRPADVALAALQGTI